MNRFEEAAAAAAPRLGAAALRDLAGRIAAGWPEQAILGAGGQRFGDAIPPVLRAHTASGVPRLEAAAYLRGLAAGHEHATTAVTVETVWSGPSTHAVPVRATAQALLEVIAEATYELVLMTYSAKPHPDICAALTHAVARGASVTVVVETLQGAGSALSGSEPAAAFGGIPGVQLWHWPVTQRAENGSKMHAKLAVADRRVLLVSSANLTQSGVAKNIEAGLLVRGGTSPRRVAEHIAELKTQGESRVVLTQDLRHGRLRARGAHWRVALGARRSPARRRCPPRSPARRGARRRPGRGERRALARVDLRPVRTAASGVHVRARGSGRT
ncbi:MAG: DISARM system phospholipase D-like protein DrmC [Pseudonocardiaceae bacterium]